MIVKMVMNKEDFKKEAEGKDSAELIRFAFEVYGKLAAVGTSLQKTGSVIIDLASRSQVASRILEMGYFPVEISPLGRASSRMALKWRRKIPVSEVVVFFRQLATMHESGLSLIYSLNTLAQVILPSQAPK